MGTLLKYIFYIILIIVIYLVGRGIYEGQINETTTVGEGHVLHDELLPAAEGHKLSATLGRGLRKLSKRALTQP